MIELLTEATRIFEKNNADGFLTQVQNNETENLGMQRLQQRQKREPELIIVSDNAKVQRHHFTPLHPVLETLNCSDSFRELLEVNGGNTRWNGGSRSSNGSFRVALTSNSSNNNATIQQTPESFSSVSSSATATNTAPTASSSSCDKATITTTTTPTSAGLCSSPKRGSSTIWPASVLVSPAATGSASGAKKVGRWESSTPSPAARSRNAGAGLSFPRRLPEHTDSFQIISRSIRRGGLSVPRSGGMSCSGGGVDGNESNSSLDGSMPLLTAFFSDLTPPPPPPPTTTTTTTTTVPFANDQELQTDPGNRASSPDEEDMLFYPSSPGCTLSKEEQNQLLLTAMAFQQVQLRHSVESAAATMTAALPANRSSYFHHHHHRSPQKGVQRASSLPIARESFDRTLRRSFGKGASKHLQLLSPRPKQQSPGSSQQQSDRITRFVSDIASAGIATHRGSAPPTCPLRSSRGLDGSDHVLVDHHNNTNNNNKNSVTSNSSPSVTHDRDGPLDFGRAVRRAQSDTLQFRNTSAYYYAPHLQRLKEEEQQEMGKIERRSIVDSSIAFFSELTPPMTDKNSKTKPTKTKSKTKASNASSPHNNNNNKNNNRSNNNINSNNHHTNTNTPKKETTLQPIHDRWAMEKTKTQILTEILVQRKPSLNHQYQRKPELDRWSMEVDQKKTKVLQEIVVQRKPSLVMGS
jgi:hypothetical protein